MSTGNNQDLNEEIKKYSNAKIICIAVGSLIAVLCLVTMIYLSVMVSKMSADAANDYFYGNIDYDTYQATLNKTIIFSVVEYVCGLIMTGGTALAVAGGIVNGVKARNRIRKLHRRNIAEEYGGNGVEF